MGRSTHDSAAPLFTGRACLGTSSPGPCILPRGARLPSEALRGVSEGSQAVGEDHTEAHSVGRGRDRLTIAEAATLLGVHKNTIRNRIKNGSYTAEMVQTERGPSYLT
jgi:excisionase family DNA binding protein